MSGSVSIPPAIPPEWALHKRIWTAWPSAPDLWGEDLDPAREEVAAMIRALAEGEEHVAVLANGDLACASARAALDASAEVFDAKFGDIWLRDTGPIFTKKNALGFRFNGWGGKYVLAGDDAVADAVAAKANVTLARHPFILEGGAIEMDGEGTLITTRQCMLNPNRNPEWTERGAEAALKEALGVEKILWLDEGLANDHTDGHIDNLARFIAPGRVVCQAPARNGTGENDPNSDVLEEIALSLAAMHDAQGRKLEIIRIPSPGLVIDEDGDAIPASHMNFIIGNKAVVVPAYSDTSAAAVKALAKVFPGRRVVGLASAAILTGGGSFHCITQQEPA